MADGALKLTLSEHTSRKVAEKAEALGLTPGDVAVSILENALRTLADTGSQNLGSIGGHATGNELDEPGRVWSADGPAPGRHATRPEDLEGSHLEREDALANLDAASSRKTIWIGDDPSQDVGEISDEGARDWSEVRPEFEAYIETLLAARAGRSD